MEPRASDGDAATTTPGDDPTEPLITEDVEFELIVQGLDEAARGELADARAFLEQLRLSGSSGEADR